MTDTPAPAIPSATVLLLRDRPGGFEVFMVKRHSGIDFAGGALVFPGGKTDPGDIEHGWDDHCDGVDGLSPIEIGNRVCGIRETFEEAGFLLARDKHDGALIGKDRAGELGEKYRNAVHSGDVGMREMAQAENLILACDLMVPYAWWITPSPFPKRFDTWFFMARAPEDQQGSHDQGESVDSLWISPDKPLQAAADQDFKIVFATRMNLKKAGRATTVDEALAAAAADTIVPVEPHVTRADEGIIFRIPEEAGYGLTEHLETDGATRVPKTAGEGR